LLDSLLLCPCKRLRHCLMTGSQILPQGVVDLLPARVAATISGVEVVLLAEVPWMLHILLRRRLLMPLACQLNQLLLQALIMAC
jgi:hypothetical protein